MKFGKRYIRTLPHQHRASSIDYKQGKRLMKLLASHQCSFLHGIGMEEQAVRLAIIWHVIGQQLMVANQHFVHLLSVARKRYILLTSAAKRGEGLDADQLLSLSRAVQEILSFSDMNTRALDMLFKKHDKVCMGSLRSVVRDLLLKQPICSDAEPGRLRVHLQLIAASLAEQGGPSAYIRNESTPNGEDYARRNLLAMTKCTSCSEELAEQHFILPCSHVFCQSCFKQSVCERQLDSSGKDLLIRTVCPECLRSSMPVASKVTSHPALISLIRSKHNMNVSSAGNHGTATTTKSGHTGVSALCKNISITQSGKRLPKVADAKSNYLLHRLMDTTSETDSAASDWAPWSPTRGKDNQNLGLSDCQTASEGMFHLSMGDSESCLSDIGSSCSIVNSSASGDGQFLNQKSLQRISDHSQQPKGHATMVSRLSVVPENASKSLSGEYQEHHAVEDSSPLASADFDLMYYHGRRKLAEGKIFVHVIDSAKNSRLSQVDELIQSLGISHAQMLHVQELLDAHPESRVGGVVDLEQGHKVIFVPPRVIGMAEDAKSAHVRTDAPGHNLSLEMTGLSHTAGEQNSHECPEKASEPIKSELRAQSFKKFMLQRRPRTAEQKVSMGSDYPESHCFAETHLGKDKEDTLAQRRSSNLLEESDSGADRDDEHDSADDDDAISLTEEANDEMILMTPTIVTDGSVSSRNENGSVSSQEQRSGSNQADCDEEHLNTVSSGNWKSESLAFRGLSAIKNLLSRRWR